MSLARPLLLAIITLEIGNPAQAARARLVEAAPPITLDKLLQGPEGAIPTRKALEGNAVVLEFWATWCAPCVAQIPHLNALSEKFKDRPVRFISITDEDPKQVDTFLERRPINGWIGLDPSRKMFKAYSVEGIPCTALVDPKGILVAMTYPEQVTETVLEDLLAGRTPKVAPYESGNPAMEVTRSAGGSEPPALLDILIRPSRAEFSSMRSSRGRFEARATTLRSAVSAAYEIQPGRIIAPSWCDEAKYDFLVATPNARETLLLPTLQHALETTFRLKVRREEQESEVLLLRVFNGGTPNLRETPTSGSMTQSNEGQIKGTGASMHQLAESLESILHRPVIDDTGLSGRYDYELDWDPKDPEALTKALRDQLKLELAPTRRPIEMLIVEAAEQPMPR